MGMARCAVQFAVRLRAFMQLLKASARPPALAESAAWRSQSEASCWITALPVAFPLDRDSGAAGARWFSRLLEGGFG